MDVQDTARLYLPHPRNQPHRPLPHSPDRLLIRAPVKPPPPIRSRAIPLARLDTAHTAAKLARMLVLPESGTDVLIPRQRVRAGSGDGAQQDLALKHLQVAKQLLALVARPHRAILGTPPRPTHVPTAIQRPPATAAAPRQVPAEQRSGAASSHHRSISRAHSPLPRLWVACDPNRPDVRPLCDRNLCAPPQIGGFSFAALRAAAQGFPLHWSAFRAPPLQTELVETAGIEPASAIA